MAAALPRRCMEVRPNRARLCGQHIATWLWRVRPYRGRRSQGRGKRTTFKNCYRFLASADRSPSKKKHAIGSARQLGARPSSVALKPNSNRASVCPSPPGSATAPTLRPRSWRAAAVAAVYSVCAFRFRSYFMKGVWLSCPGSVSASCSTLSNLSYPSW